MTIDRIQPGRMPEATRIQLNGILGGILSGQVNFTALSMPAGAQSIEVQPTANPIDSLTSVNLVGETQSEVEREYFVNLGFTINKGAGASSPERDKVLLYTGVTVQSGCGDAWNWNPVMTLESGSGTYNAQLAEIDFNNNNAHCGDADGGAGLAAPVAYPVTITGAGSKRSTAAIGIFGPGSAIWNRGIVIGSSSVKQASFQDLAGADISLDIRGSHVSGLDTSQGTFSAQQIKATGFEIDPMGKIKNTGMPTSSAGLASGTLWNDSGTVKIA